MSEKINLSEGLENEIRFYADLFRQMRFYQENQYRITWSLSERGEERQIDLASGKNHLLNHSDLAVLAIGLSLGDDDSHATRIAHQFDLLRLGIITHDDIMHHVQYMHRQVRGEHASKLHYLNNMTENAGKIILLRRAYEKLQKLRSEGELDELEDRVLLGMVVGMLGGKYRLRPYMVDEDIEPESSWVEYYDHLFDGFSYESYLQYSSHLDDYSDLWYQFLNIRNMIAKNKWMRTIDRYYDVNIEDASISNITRRAIAKIMN